MKEKLKDMAVCLQVIGDVGGQLTKFTLGRLYEWWTCYVDVIDVKGTQFSFY